MALENKQYVLGRGKVFFNQFNLASVDDEIGSGERYIGNTPSFATNQAYSNLDHYDADEGIRVKDDTVQLQLDRSGAFTLDNISIENVAMMMGTTAVTESQAAATGEAETFLINQLGLYYQLGADNVVPDGVGKVSSVVVTDNTGVHATGTITVAAQPAAADTITINGHPITFVAGAPAAHQVQLGGTTAITAEGISQEINAYPHLYAVRSVRATNVVTLTARSSGVGGNAIALAKSGTNPTLSGATLSGGTNSGTVTQLGNYEVDTDLGRLHILVNAANITAGSTIEVQYNLAINSRPTVVDDQLSVEGQLRFVSTNPRGPKKNYFWPRVKLTPNGEYQLKGDAWQQMGFNFDVLQSKVNPTAKRIYIREIG